jgi:hypothetical protein
LPLFRTITITNQEPSPNGRVEVTPDAGRIIFQNNDPLEYRIRLYKPNTDPDAGGIDLLLPANGFLSVIIRRTTNSATASWPPIVFWLGRARVVVPSQTERHP